MSKQTFDEALREILKTLQTRTVLGEQKAMSYMVLIDAAEQSIKQLIREHLPEMQSDYDQDGNKFVEDTEYNHALLDLVKALGL